MSKNHRYVTHGDEPDGLVDEQELLELGLDIRPFCKPRDRPVRIAFKTMRERVHALLVDAGYEPSHIPKSLRTAALDVAWCWERGLCDEDRIAFALGRSPEVIRNAARALRVAGTPNALLRKSLTNPETATKPAHTGATKKVKHE
jgi:hypothetical protein